MRNTRPPRQTTPRSSAGLRLGGLALALLPLVPAGAQDATALEKVERENADLRRRLEALEAVAQKEGLIPSGQAPTKSVSALSDITISGFVQASYFYNTDTPDDGYSDGYLWNTKHNSFSLNKFKLTIASPPVERSGEDWDAGYRVSMIWGEDAPVLNTGGEYQGFEALREAYVDLNVPIGDGLNVKVGQLISLLNYESGDGGAVNANFSQGYQWFFTGNGPAAGVQAAYGVTDWLDLTFRVQNGLYQGPIDSNDAKTYMGKIGLKPGPDTWLALIGFGGSESDTMDLLGGSLLAGHSFTPKLGVGFEFDYFQFDTGSTADLWSIGGWVWYDFTDKVTLAFRGEYLKDEDGGGLKGINLPGRPNSAILSPDPDGDIASLTLTLTYKPVPSVRIQPELRYDTTAYSGGYDGSKERFTIGAGISYLF